jgi:PBP1b-binding outer membrane lipoprotein LpoB
MKKVIAIVLIFLLLAGCNKSDKSEQKIDLDLSSITENKLENIETPINSINIDKKVELEILNLLKKSKI